MIRNQGNNPINHWNERMEYLKINISKETKGLYIENYKTLIKEIKDDTIVGEIYHIHGSEESM